MHGNAILTCFDIFIISFFKREREREREREYKILSNFIQILSFFSNNRTSFVVLWFFFVQLPYRCIVTSFSVQLHVFRFSLVSINPVTKSVS